LLCNLTLAQSSYNVRDFGAVGDGATKDTIAFQKALDSCAVNGGGDVVVPAGRFLVGSVQIGNRTILRLAEGSVITGSPDAEDYPTIDIRWEGRWQPGRRALIYSTNVDHTGIIGPGLIEGNPAMAAPQNPRGSVVIEPISCNHVRWEGFTVTQGGNWATHPTYCTDVVIKGVKIRGGRDGIDIDSCSNVRIEDCDIDTGDDSISLKSGRGMDGARIGKPVQDVVITGCTLRGRNFACIGIGSETSAGCRNVKIENCTMTARTFGIYIKSRIGRAGVHENISADKIDILGGGFLRINLVGAGNTNTAADPVPGLIGYPSAKNLSFSNIRLNNATAIVDAVQIAPEKPVEGLTLTNVSGSAAKGISIVHAKDVVLRDIKVTGIQGPMLMIDNVTGNGLEGAERYVAPRRPGATTSSAAPEAPAQLAAATQPALDRPDPAQIPVPRIAAPMGVLPGVGELPARPQMPDVLTMNDGTKVTTADQWPKRRQEILRVLEYYAVGQAPPPPGNVKSLEVKSQLVAGGKFRYRLVHLTFGPQEKLSLDIGIFTPAEGGPFPAVIAPSGTPPGATPLPRQPNGPTQGRGLDVLLVVGPGEPASRPAPATQVGRSGINDPERTAATNAALARGYAYIIFNHNDCGEDTTLRNLDGSWAFRNTRFFPAYPNYDWGLLRSWAWGVSRIVDYLETDPSIDKSKLVITGASRTGTSAMVAAAFDDRIAMGAPVVTGGGGIGAYRFAGPRNSETLSIMMRKYPNWFSPNLHQFWGQPEKLPFDQHWFLAACAPRAFIALEGETDTISLPEAVKASIDGARPAFELFGQQDRLGVNYAKHGHAFTAEDWDALLDFADKHLRGKNVDRSFNRFPTAPAP
jgi:hypothetical protein